MRDLAEAAGVSAGTIKHYLREGLLPEPVKTSRNMAWYPREFVERVRLIKQLQEERFLPLKVIRDVLENGGDLDGPGRLRAGPVAVLGAGHLACAFINYLRVGEHVSFVVDDNPHKHGLRMPGSRLPIRGASALLEERVALVVEGGRRGGSGLSLGLRLRLRRRRRLLRRSRLLGGPVLGLGAMRRRPRLSNVGLGRPA